MATTCFAFMVVSFYMHVAGRYCICWLHLVGSWESVYKFVLQLTCSHVTSWRAGPAFRLGVEQRMYCFRAGYKQCILLWYLYLLLCTFTLRASIRGTLGRAQGRHPECSAPQQVYSAFRWGEGWSQEIRDGGHEWKFQRNSKYIMCLGVDLLCA